MKQDGKAWAWNKTRTRTKQTQSQTRTSPREKALSALFCHSSTQKQRTEVNWTAPAVLDTLLQPRNFVCAAHFLTTVQCFAWLISDAVTCSELYLAVDYNTEAKTKQKKKNTSLFAYFPRPSSLKTMDFCGLIFLQDTELETCHIWACSINNRSIYWWQQEWGLKELGHVHLSQSGEWCFWDILLLQFCKSESQTHFLSLSSDRNENAHASRISSERRRKQKQRRKKK